MWYHWILVVVGVYLVGSAIYSVVTGTRTVTSLAMNGVQMAIGAGLGYYGYSSAMTPAVPSFVPQAMAPAVSTMMGGMRKLFRK
jgi:hypothetical protein